MVSAQAEGKTAGRRRDTAVMAVTKQLARISVEYLADCRQSASESPDGDPHWDPQPADVLDLDWAPILLERACELAGLDDVHLNALRQATDGDSAIDLGFLNTHPHAIGPFGPAPTALSAAQAAHVSELLVHMNMPAILAALPADDTQTASLIGYGADKIAGDPRKYLLKHFNALREFYLEASQRHLLIVLWWD
ncbi:hypothetical protein Scani_00560 [Streptomyces caniferus]|uniref:DUF1877 domain-containing protein n=2 Tax=Streptomyces caniferus TaxID=285557 RepID=A0A640RY94_9ACTN|nr:hypothetical protein Scani_00560 [Streptomyces caniferus]